MINYVTATEAFKCLKSGDRLYWPCIAGAPEYLIQELAEYVKRNGLHNIHINHLYTEGWAGYVEGEYEQMFHLDSFFVGGNVRKATQAGSAGFIPCSLSDTGRIIREGIQPIDVEIGRAHV